MRLLRLVTGICFCVLILAVAIAIFDLVLLQFTDRIAGCQFHPEIMPSFGCHGDYARAVEIVLNLPLIVFFYGPLFTLWPGTLNPVLLRIMNAGAVVLVLGLTYPVLWLIARRRSA